MRPQDLNKHVHAHMCTMVNMTIKIPDDLKKKMDSFKEINWSAVAREAFEKQVDGYEVLKRFTSDSTLTEEDAIRLGRDLARRLSKRRKGSAPRR